MPRIAEPRQPAEPHSADQKERYRRMLRAAAKLGDEHGLERMQMNDVAKEAGVAIATLYRYFPSKNDLFVGILNAQIDQLGQTAAAGTKPDGATHAEIVAEILIGAGRNLLRRPLLATAMLQANNTAQLGQGRDFTEYNAAFHMLLLDAMGVPEPGEEDLRMMRITEQTWYGILISVLNGIIDQNQAEEDVRLATRLLLGPRYDQGVTP